MDFPDKRIYIVAAPFFPGLAGLRIVGIGERIGEYLALNFVGVKIIVKMNPVYLIVLHHFSHDFRKLLPDFRDSRVVIIAVAIRQHPVGMKVIVVVPGQREGIGSHGGTVGVEPGVEVHPPAVRLGDHPFQGVGIGIRGHALFPAEVARPGGLFRRV